MSALVDKKGINGLIDGLTNIITLMANVTEGVGGGRNALLMLGSVGAQVFSSQIANSLNTTITNLNNAKAATEEFKVAIDNLNSFKTMSIIDDETVNKIIQYKTALTDFANVVTKEETEQGNQLIDTITGAMNENAAIEKRIREALSTYGAMTGLDAIEQEELFKDSTALDQSNLSSLMTEATEGMTDLGTAFATTNSVLETFDKHIEEDTVDITLITDALEVLNQDTLPRLNAFLQNANFSDLINAEDKDAIESLKRDLSTLQSDVTKYTEE